MRNPGDKKGGGKKGEKKKKKKRVFLPNPNGRPDQRENKRKKGKDKVRHSFYKILQS